MAEEIKSVFDDLFHVNVNDHTEKKNGLTYLSWSWAWAETKQRYPEATYKVKTFFDGTTERPYLFDENLGYMVMTSVTINGETQEMWLPVMDGANKAQKNIEYTYETKYGEKKVAPATMFDINTAIMRCLVKNLGVFGLGLYIYSGLDLPEETEEEKEKKKVLATKIDKAKVTVVLNKCKELGLDSAKVSAAYKVSEVKEMTVEMWQKFIKACDEMPEDLQKYCGV